MELFCVTIQTETFEETFMLLKNVLIGACNDIAWLLVLLICVFVRRTLTNLNEEFMEWQHRLSFKCSSCLKALCACYEATKKKLFLEFLQVSSSHTLYVSTQCFVENF